MLVFTGVSTRWSSLGFVPVGLHWGQYPLVFTGVSTRWSSLGSVPVGREIGHFDQDCDVINMAGVMSVYLLAVTPVTAITQTRMPCTQTGMAC